MGKSQVASGRVPEAAESLAAALEPFAEMLEELPAEARTAFLARPASASYLIEAEATFRSSGRTDEGQRLQSLRQP
jgi:hypothetical protein